MAIVVPKDGDIISAGTFGIPVANEVNRITPITTVTAWTALTLQNSWVPLGSSYTNPVYRKIGDIVYVQGSIRNAGTFTGPGQSIASTLPVGFRPLTNLMFPAIFGGTDTWGGPGRVDAMASGNILVTYSATLVGCATLTCFAFSFSTIAIP